MAFCRKCGNYISIRQQYCNSCGAPVVISTASLVHDAAAGDTEARDELYQRTYQEQYDAVLPYVKTPADAHRILQESYRQAFSELETLQAPERFMPWLSEIVSENVGKYRGRQSGLPVGGKIGIIAGAAVLAAAVAFGSVKILEKREALRSAAEVTEKRDAADEESTDLRSKSAAGESPSDEDGDSLGEASGTLLESGTAAESVQTENGTEAAETETVTEAAETETPTEAAKTETTAESEASGTSAPEGKVLTSSELQGLMTGSEYLWLDIDEASAKIIRGGYLIPAQGGYRTQIFSFNGTECTLPPGEDENHTGYFLHGSNAKDIIDRIFTEGTKAVYATGGRAAVIWNSPYGICAYTHAESEYAGTDLGALQYMLNEQEIETLFASYGLNEKLPVPSSARQN